MPTERIGDIAVPKGGWSKIETVELPCYNPDHNPPQPSQPGRYRHTCPGCGQVSEFVVRPSMRA